MLGLFREMGDEVAEVRKGIAFRGNVNKRILYDLLGKIRNINKGDATQKQQRV
jgi:hypothetical protein